MIYNDCDDVRELIPAYALGATDPEETWLVEMALADCPELLDDLSEYAALTEAMLHAVALRHEAPPADRILAPVRRTGIGSRRFTNHTSATTTQTPALRTSRFAIVALLVIAILAVGSNLLWFNQVRDLRRAQEQWQASQSRLPTPQQMPVILRAEESYHRRLTATAAGPQGAQAQVIWNTDLGVGAMYAAGLAQLSDETVYHLWAMRDDKTINLGQFQVDAEGVGFLIFQLPEPIARFSALGISPEPASGSAQPTHDYVVVGKI